MSRQILTASLNVSGRSTNLIRFFLSISVANVVSSGRFSGGPQQWLSATYSALSEMVSDSTSRISSESWKELMCRRRFGNFRAAIAGLHLGCCSTQHDNQFRISMVSDHGSSNVAVGSSPVPFSSITELEHKHKHTPLWWYDRPESSYNSI
jgi:hypothetical protein